MVPHARPVRRIAATAIRAAVLAVCLAAACADTIEEAARVMINARATVPRINHAPIADRCSAADCSIAIAVATHVATEPATVVAKVATLAADPVDCLAVDPAARIAAILAAIHPAIVVAKVAIQAVIPGDGSAMDRAARVAATRAAIRAEIVVANPEDLARAQMGPGDYSADWVLTARVAADVMAVVHRADRSDSEIEAMHAINAAVPLAIVVVDRWVPTATATASADLDRDLATTQV